MCVFIVPHTQTVCVSCSKKIFACASLARALRELTRAHVRMDVDTHKRINIHTYIRTFRHVCIRTCWPRGRCTDTYARARFACASLARALREPCASSRKLIYVCAHRCVACIRTYVYTYTLAYLHSDIRTYSGFACASCLRVSLREFLAQVPCASDLALRELLAQALAQGRLLTFRYLMFLF